MRNGRQSVRELAESKAWVQILAAEPEGAELAVTFFRIPAIVASPLRKRRESALLAEKMAENRLANEKGPTTLSAVNPFAASAEERT